jgi:inhibitor of KinA
MTIVAAGDSAVIVELEDRIDVSVNEQAIAIAESVERAKIIGVLDVVPTYRSVAIYFDPLRVDYAALIAHIERDSASVSHAGRTTRPPVRIAVCYDPEFGIDLQEVAAFAGLSEAEVVRLHTTATYRVFMLGFVAGFAYLGTVDSRIAMPRRPTPRLRVSPGSVAIAGVQTGVYPAETPGGWRLVGRTPIKPFEPDRAEPFLLKAGDAVQFFAITRAEYDAWPST